MHWISKQIIKQIHCSRRKITLYRYVTEPCRHSDMYTASLVLWLTLVCSYTSQNRSILYAGFIWGWAARIHPTWNIQIKSVLPIWKALKCQTLGAAAHVIVLVCWLENLSLSHDYLMLAMHTVLFLAMQSLLTSFWRSFTGPVQRIFSFKISHYLILLLPCVS